MPLKKLILIFLAAFAFSCGDGSNRSSERDDGLNDMENTETVEPDTTSTDMESEEMRTDTSSTWDQDRDNLNDDNLNSRDSL